jgi:hypothetical protein
MSNEELDLLTDFNQICLDVEILAIKNLHTVELPLCGFLTSLSAKDCVILLVSNFFHCDAPICRLYFHILTLYIMFSFSQFANIFINVLVYS